MAERALERWASGLLKRLQIRENPENLRMLVGWAKAEGGHFHNDARYNVLNTTQPMHGAGNTGSQGNIKQYRSWNQGLKATVRTLENGRYGGILHALKAGSVDDFVNAIGSSPWGTSGSLVAQTVHATGRVRPGAGPLGGGGGGSPATGPTYRTVAGVDNSPVRQQLLQTYVSERGRPGALANLGLALQQAQDSPSRRIQTRGARPATAGGGGKVARPSKVQDIMAEAQLINAAHVNYLWGGGHQGKILHGSKVTPLDCSGAVSRVLGINPMVAQQFESWGKPGHGKRVTIYAKDTHVIMSIRDKHGVEHFFGTSGSNKGGGAGWISRSQISDSYLAGFVARHPAGL